MKRYDDLVATADEQRRRGDHKEASISYGRALGLGGPLDAHCREWRGACARRVGDQRLQRAVDHPERRQKYLEEAARWLAKAEANLDSALEQAPAAAQARIRLEQAATEESLARFLVMCGGDPSRRLAVARHHREVAATLPV